MDSLTVIILIFIGFIGLMALLFYVPARQDKENEYTKISEERDSKTNTHIITEEKSSSSKTTIYAFREIKEKRLCPFCDGENSLEAKVCNICRRDL
jgi:hypothetical protein